MTHAPATATDDGEQSPSPRFITAKTAASLLGLSRSRVYELMDEGVIPSARLGYRRMIPAAAFNALLDELQAS